MIELRKIWDAARVICGIAGAVIALTIIPELLIYVCRGFLQLLLGVVVDCLIIGGFIWLIVSGANSALDGRVHHRQ